MTVKQAQHLLAYLGYYVGSVDGEWGTLSKTACKAFQKDFGGIQVDGWAGTETQKALKHAVAYGMPAKAVPEPEEIAPQAFPSVTTPSGGTVRNDQLTGTFWDEIEYFTREEFRCQCGGKYCNGFPAEPDETLVRLVNDLRKQAGRPAHRSSGLRCPTWNSIQGGVGNSKHMYGKALDFFIEGVSGPQLLAMAQADKRTSYAYIIDGQYVHVDVD